MNIIVTGASRGVGYELVKLYVGTDGVKNVFAISRNAERLDKLKEECEGEANVVPVPFDLCSGNFEQDLLPAISDKVGQIDIIVNNAGYLVNKPFAQLTDKEIYDQYNVNVFAIFRLIRACMPLLKVSTNPHIVNISSMGGFQGSAKFAGLSAYSSSKAAVVGLTECLAEELKGENISVNCLAIGAVQTEMLSLAFPGYQALLSANEMAAYVRDFSINGHQYYNGKVLPVSLSTP